MELRLRSLLACRDPICGAELSSEWPFAAMWFLGREGRCGVGGLVGGEVGGVCVCEGVSGCQNWVRFLACAFCLAASGTKAAPNRAFVSEAMGQGIGSFRTSKIKQHFHMGPIRHPRASWSSGNPRIPPAELQELRMEC